jgi:hypothetical protein
MAARAAEDAAGVDPAQVVERAWRNLYGRSSIERVEVRTRHPDGREFLRVAQVTRRASRDGEPNRMLVRLLGPGELRGVGLLLLEQPDSAYDAFLYQPSLRRTRRISMAQRQDAFFGTDVWFEDLEAKRAGQWRARLLTEEPALGRPAWKIELVPASIPSGYERVVIWFDQALPVMLRGEFHRGGRRVKSFAIDPERVIERDGFQIPLATTFQGESGSRTEVQIAEIEIRDALADRLFTHEALELGDDRSDARAE